MSKKEIRIVEIEKISDKINENEIINDIIKNEFFNYMDKKGYSFEVLQKLFECNKISSSEMNNFNVFIRKINKEMTINIYEMVIYFEMYFTKIKKILNLFDKETKFILKKELSKKYHIKIDENNLKLILG